MYQYTYSITITHYNAPNLLARMLSSIPERDDIQVIVVDDCSTEENKAILSSLKHKNLEIVFSPKNYGAGFERNVGFEHVKGKWLIACDCDDLFAKGAFDILDKYRDSDFDYICYCVKYLDSELKPIGIQLRSDASVRKFLKEKTKNAVKYFKFWNTEPWNKLISVDFLRKNKIQWEPCRINVDVLFSYRVALKAKKYSAISDELYYFVGDGNSVTRKERSVEREFEFYLAAQKRNGFFKILGYGYPFSRPDFMYLPFLLKKRGISETFQFYKLRKKRWNDVLDARKLFVPYLDGIDLNHVLDIPENLS